MRENRVKQALQEGGVVIGTFVKTASPSIVEVLGYAGLHFVVLDCEHGPLGAETVEQLVRAADVTGMVPIVRVPGVDPAALLNALDVGALGVQVPGVERPEEAALIVQSTKYPPMGERGTSLSTRAAHYGAIPGSEYFGVANRQTLVVVHAETRAAMERVEEIASTPGIDVIFMGPADLSQSLGVPGQFDHPAVVDAMARVVEVCRGAGIAAGTFAGNADEARKWAAMGVQYLTISTDWSLLMRVGRQLVSEVESIAVGHL